MRYRLYLPLNYSASNKYPLVLYLHGSGASGTDNGVHVIRHIAGLINLTESQYPAILLAPQLPNPSGWYPGNPEDLTPNILQSVLDTYAADDNRLYVTGLSMGGFGSLSYLDSYTDGTGIEFAAAVPMSGGYTYTVNSQAVENFRDVPIWLTHGDADTTVDVTYSRNTYRSLVGLTASDPIQFNTVFNPANPAMNYPTAVSGNVRYTEIPNGGHSGWDQLYNSPVLYDWMFAQAIPEPSTTLLSAVALATLFVRRRKSVPHNRPSRSCDNLTGSSYRSGIRYHALHGTAAASQLDR